MSLSDGISLNCAYLSSDREDEPMKKLCTLTGMALIASAVFLSLQGAATLSSRASELRDLLEVPVTPLDALWWEFTDYAAPFVTAVAHLMLALVVFGLPDRLILSTQPDVKLGIVDRAKPSSADGE